MKALLKLALGIDLMNKQISHLASWAVFLSAMVSAANAMARYSVGTASAMQVALITIGSYLLAFGTAYYVIKQVGKFNDSKAKFWGATAVFTAVIIGLGYLYVRTGFGLSSNGWLEMQWYLFAGTVMLGTSYVLRMNEHVRVDILYGRYPGNGKVYLDLFGLLIFMLPFTVLMTFMSWPLFEMAFTSKEMSSNAGGLIRWPALLTLPLGFGLLSLQGFSEVIKRIAYLMHLHEMDAHYERPLQ